MVQNRFDLESYLKERSKKVEKVLKKYFPKEKD